MRVCYSLPRTKPLKLFIPLLISQVLFLHKFGLIVLIEAILLLQLLSYKLTNFHFQNHKIMRKYIVVVNERRYARGEEDLTLTFRSKAFVKTRVRVVYH